MIEKVAVLGAGTMGAGIAQACAQSGLDVTLRDVEQSYLESAIKRLRQPLEERVEQGKTDRETVDAIFARITTTTDLAEAVGDVDLVIEAVPEDLEIKHEVFSEVDEAAPEDAIFATNTSSLRVADIAEATDRPERFAGLHFFYPAQINKLLEIVAHEGTSDATLEALERFGTAIGKIALETADRAGFCVNRFFVPWINEAVHLLDEGVADVPTIEEAAKQAFDIPMGPFQLMNETGVAISLHAQRSLHEAFGDFYEPAQGLVEQVEQEKGDWTIEGSPDEAAFEPVQRRLKGVAYGVSAKLVEEGVASPVDTDKGAIVGLRWSKGPLQLMNEEGLERALELVEALDEEWDRPLPVADLLREKAEAGEAFELPTVGVQHVDEAALLRIQHPASRNALSTRVLEDLEEAIETAEASQARAIVLTGEGTTFVSGADIAEMKDQDPQEAREYAELGQHVSLRLEECELPVVAAINGYAFGGGLELALACDLIYVAEEATVGLPETSLGIQPGFGGTQRLPQHVGLQCAKELIFTADRISGTEAAEIGLARKAVNRAELLPEVLDLVDRIQANAPLAIESAKRSINEGVDVDTETGLALELEHSSQLFGTEDQVEGMEAFMERRPPEFQGE
jgi:enoyl-CoA hydratase/3-hydroxyacyl-CoA dehydrogenase